MAIAIISVDPGKMTGVAEWIAPGNDPKEGTFESFEYTVEQFFDYIKTRIGELDSLGYQVHLVCESFLITVQTAKNTQATWSLELIGVLKFLAHLFGLPGVTMQTPSTGKTFGTNGKLKYLGWMRTGTIDGVKYVGHANDAARHLATYGATRGLIFTTQQLIDMADV